MINYEKLLGRPITLAVLKYLTYQSSGETGRKIAGAIGYSPQSTLNALQELENCQLVSVKKIGRANLYQLNHEHWFIQDGLAPLWSKIDNWPKMLGTYYNKKLRIKPISIILFGSYAREDAEPESDLDILFVYDNKTNIDDELEIIVSMNGEIVNRFGLIPSPKTISINEFKKSVKKDVGLMRTIFREGKSIFGLLPSEIINYDSKKN